MATDEDDIFESIASDAARQNVQKSAAKSRSARRSPLAPTLIAAMIVASVGTVIICGVVGMRASRKAPPPTLQNTATEYLQDERLKFIRRMQEQELIQKVDTQGGEPRVYVFPKFYVVTFDDKQNVIAVCYAWAFGLPEGGANGFDGVLSVYDSLNGKRIGVFSSADGLQLD